MMPKASPSGEKPLAVDPSGAKGVPSGEIYDTALTWFAVAES